MVNRQGRGLTAEMTERWKVRTGRPVRTFLTFFKILLKNLTVLQNMTVFEKSIQRYNLPHRSDVVKKVLYIVVLQSQLGPRTGELLIQEDAQSVSGSFSLLGYRNRFSGSLLQSGKYLISGALRSPADPEPYDAIFTVREGRLSGGVITPHGCWDLTGVQAAPQPKSGR